MIKFARKLIMSSLAIAAAFSAVPAQANILRDVQNVGVAVGVIPIGCATNDIVWAARCHARNAQYQMRNRRIRAERQDERRPAIVQSQAVRQQSVRQAPVDPRIIAMVRDLENSCSSGNQSACRQLGAR